MFSRFRSCVLVSMFCVWSSAGLAVEDPVIAVIVSALSANAVSVSVGDLASIYWRKTLYNAHGKPLHPVNLFAEHPLRVRFSQQVLHSHPKSQLGYWNGLYFNGVLPPYTVQSEEAMLRYVADTENAVGYVDACKVDLRVRAVLWVSNGKVLTESPMLHCETLNP
ncbi:hypothetical protein [Methylophilus aquaticus]|uniref:Uncharacterized protein n=1 Tax=Methylophilus aquaticus TaxID=1971610 RepID=A0ABT9JPE9_9PROT|nr:hypothetical protein [Methylophilus aquaticus]MDP8566450.1 hypothetical protein [Methylophilus aquaticus]